MGFYWSRLSIPDTSLNREIFTPDLMVFEILNLAAALYLLEHSATPEIFTVNRSLKGELAHASATAILDEIQNVGLRILKVLDIGSSSNLVRYLVLPDPLSTFIRQFLGNDDLGIVGAGLRSSSKKGYMLSIV